MRRRAWRAVLLCGLLGGLTLTVNWGCLSIDQTPGPLRVGDNLWAEYVVAGAAHPSAVGASADGHVFYTERKTGQIRLILNGALLAEPFATVPVNYADDRGLLGIAVHPNYADNHRVYVFYTRSDTGLSTGDPQAVVDNRVVYFEGAGEVATSGEVFVVSLPADVGSRHVSGRLAFAADGKLLVALGDLTYSDSALDFAEPVGKLLRYNDDGSIPGDNPTAGSAYYARGFRDVRGLCIDPVTGTPFALDRNLDGHEELNRIRAGGNYGWPAVAGIAHTEDQLQYAADNSDYIDPLRDTGSGNPGLAGGSFNPSTRYGPATYGQLFYGEAATGAVLSVELTSTREGVADTSTFATGFPSAITDVAFTPAGTLYVACETAILRIVPAP